MVQCGLPGVGIQLCHVRTMLSWTSHLVFLGLGFLTSKVGSLIPLRYVVELNKSTHLRYSEQCSDAVISLKRDIHSKLASHHSLPS